jgi:hypothetical protein
VKLLWTGNSLMALVLSYKPRNTHLGHTTKKGTPAIQTTVRYTQVSREEVKEKLKLLRS